jgi:hypothetical protein
MCPVPLCFVLCLWSRHARATCPAAPPPLSSTPLPLVYHLYQPVELTGLSLPDTASALLAPPALLSDPVEHLDFALVASSCLPSAVPLLTPDATAALCDWVVVRACDQSGDLEGLSMVRDIASATLAAAATSEVPGLVAGLVRALAVLLERQVGQARVFFLRRLGCLWWLRPVGPSRPLVPDPYPFHNIW